MRKFCLACLLFFASVRPIRAVSVSILSYPTSISEDKFSVTVQTEGAASGTNYLRVDLYQDGTKNYFGETDNGESWYGGSDGKQYYAITIVSGTPNIATVSARIGEPSLSDYPGPGIYKLRIRRYTSSGGQGSEDPLPVSLSITKVWPSPSPSPTPTPTATPTPDPTSPPSPSPTPTPTPKPSLKPSVSPNMATPPPGTVAGESTQVDLSIFGHSPPPSTVPSGSPPGQLVLNQSRAKTAILVGSGLLILSLASYFGYKKYLSYIMNQE